MLISACDSYSIPPGALSSVRFSISSKSFVPPKTDGSLDFKKPTICGRLIQARVCQAQRHLPCRPDTTRLAWHPAAAVAGLFLLLLCYQTNREPSLICYIPEEVCRPGLGLQSASCKGQGRSDSHYIA